MHNKAINNYVFLKKVKEIEQKNNKSEVSNQKLMKTLHESDVIMKELRNGKGKGYTDTEILFKALDK